MLSSDWVARTQHLGHEPHVQMIMAIHPLIILLHSDLTIGVGLASLDPGLVALPVICQNPQCSNNQVKVTDLWSPRRNCRLEVRL